MPSLPACCSLSRCFFFGGIDCLHRHVKLPFLVLLFSTRHNGCFDFKTGLPKRLPVKRRLATFPVRTEKLFGLTHVYVQVNNGKHRQIAYDTDEA